MLKLMKSRRDHGRISAASEVKETKLKNSEISEVGSLFIVLIWFAKKDVLMEDVLDVLLDQSVVIFGYNQNQGGWH